MGEIYSLQHSRAFNAIYFLECFHSFQGAEPHTWWNSVKKLEKVSALMPLSEASGLAMIVIM